MSESQSRYSIVERLTEQKLELSEERGKLDEQVENHKRQIEQLTHDLSIFETDAKENIDRDVRNKKRQIDATTKGLTFILSQKDSKLNQIEEKLSELNKALKSIEEISKTAPTPEQQI